MGIVLSREVPKQDWCRRWQMRTLTWWAHWLERTVAGKQVKERHTATRNRALRFARRRGATVEELATRVGIGTGQMSRILKADTKRRPKKLTGPVLVREEPPAA